ncbi:MAG: hypothetical protein F2599_00655 [Actinobacteria bacterium]|uniref:Unannotated protein n=1 Tax=freshwater metagenome TaxID=449393 RepID=A0A6J6HPV0_9ZZZZ|nr:hypothetical protein [Actinomycetota bacterium]
MFKPNIRGYNRSKIGFTLRGWIFAGEIKILFLNRWPWRKNWLHELNTNQDLEVSFSRRGDAHLHTLFESGSLKDRDRHTKTFKIGTGSLIALFLVAPLMLWQTSSEPNYQDSLQPAIQPKKEPEQLFSNEPTKSGCPKVEDTYPVLEDWVLGKKGPLVQITRSAQIEVGGIRSSHAEFRCGNSVFDFELLEALTPQGWRLRKSTQLEN